MKKLYLLVKIQLMSWMGINKALHTKKNKYAAPTLGGASIKPKKGRSPVAMAILSIFLVVYFFGASFLYSEMAAQAALATGGSLTMVPGLMMTASALLTIIMGIYSTGRVLFKYSDYDITMSLPVPVKTIAASRLVVLYFYELLFTIVLMVPAMIVYAKYTQPAFLYWPVYIICILLTPCFPLVISSVLGTVITWIGSRAKRFGNAMNTILTLVFVGAVMFISFSMGASSDEAYNQGVANVSSAASTWYPLAAMFIKAACEQSWLSFLAFAVISVGVMTAFALLVSVRYRELCTRVNTGGGRTKGKKAVIRVRGQLSTLFRRECGRYFSSTIYLTNTAIGPFLAIIFSAIFLFSGGIPGLDEGSNAMVMGLLAPIAPLIVSVLICMGSTTGSSISMEGHSLWVVRSMPVSASTLFLAKVLTNMTIAGPSIIICAVLLALALKADALLCLLLIVIPLVYAVASALFGLWVNLKLPKLDWTNEAQVVKQSAAAGISLLVMPVLPVIFAVVGFITQASALVMLLSVLVPAVLSLLLIFTLKKRGEAMLMAL